MTGLLGRKSELPQSYRKIKDRWNYPIGYVPFYIATLFHDLPPLEEMEEAALAFARSEKNNFARSVSVYLQLLGKLPTEKSTDALVKDGEENWEKRRKDRFYSDTDGYFGYDFCNDWYVDWMLGCILHKIGWQGESIHRFKWG